MKLNRQTVIIKTILFFVLIIFVLFRSALDDLQKPLDDLAQQFMQAETLVHPINIVYFDEQAIQ